MASDDDEDREFSPAERRLIRAVLKNQERVDWFWASARIWAKWISAGIIAGAGFVQAVRESGILKKLGG